MGKDKEHLEIGIHFAGSFQCRLATEPAPTNASPKIPTIVESGGEEGYKNGACFAYDEKPFDRIIRLKKQDPVRNGGVDPWEPTKVTKVEVVHGFSLQTMRRPPVQKPDTLIGQPVSLGSAKFDTKVGQSAGGREGMIDLTFTIGDQIAFFSADPKSQPVTPEFKNDKAISVKEISAKKEAAIQGVKLHPAREEYLTKHRGCFLSVLFYDQFCDYEFELTNMHLKPFAGSVIQDLHGFSDKYRWKLRIRFSRFDCDSLTGKVKGMLMAKRLT